MTSLLHFHTKTTLPQHENDKISLNKCSRSNLPNLLAAEEGAVDEVAAVGSAATAEEVVDTGGTVTTDVVTTAGEVVGSAATAVEAEAAVDVPATTATKKVTWPANAPKATGVEGVETVTKRRN